MSLSVALRRSPSLASGPAGMGGPPGVPVRWLGDQHASEPTGPLMIDLEAVPVRLGGQPFLVQAGDRGSWRPLPHPGLELLDSLGVARDLDLDAAVAQVA